MSAGFRRPRAQPGVPAGAEAAGLARDALPAPPAARPETSGAERGFSAGHGRIIVILLGVWILLEFGKPVSQAFKIPMLITALAFLSWLSRLPEHWPRQVVMFILFVGLMALHVPFARNNYHAYWATYYMAVTIAAVLPMARFAGSRARVQFLMDTYIVTMVYVGLWAITHGGFGPLGASAAQDENYVAQAMGIGFPMAFFRMMGARSPLLKAAFATAAGIFVVAAMVGMSRGGFLGMLAVGLYCWLWSPRKIAALGAVAALGVVTVTLAPAGYWDEMATITEERSDELGSGDLRLELWKIATRQYLANPIAGVGPGNFKWWVEDFQTPEQLERWDRSFAGAYVTHSLYFELIAELGTLGVLLFAGVLRYNHRDVRWIVKAHRKLRGGKDERALFQLVCLARGLEGAMLAFLVNSAFLSNLYSSYFWVLGALIVALRSAGDEIAAGSEGARSSPVEARVDRA